MGVSISLVEPDSLDEHERLGNSAWRCVQVPAHQVGSTIAVGGDSEANFTCTYNYGEVYALIPFDWRWIENKTGEESIPILKRVIYELTHRTKQKPKPYRDYWAPTPGNALVPLETCLAWAKLHPKAIWKMGW